MIILFQDLFQRTNSMGMAGWLCQILAAEHQTVSSFPHAFALTKIPDVSASRNVVFNSPWSIDRDCGLGRWPFPLSLGPRQLHVCAQIMRPERTGIKPDLMEWLALLRMNRVWMEARKSAFKNLLPFPNLQHHTTSQLHMFILLITIYLSTRRSKNTCSLQPRIAFMHSYRRLNNFASACCLLE